MNLPEKIVYEEVEKEATTPMEEMEIKVVTEIEKVERKLIIPSNMSHFTRPDFQWLIPGYIPKVGIGQIFGPSGAGKTFVATDIGATLTSGLGEWQGVKCKTNCRVAYLAKEGQKMLPVRFKAWCKYHHIDERIMDNNLFFLDTDYSSSVYMDMNSDDYKTLLKNLQENGPFDIIFLDTYSQFSNGDNENSRETAQDFINAISKIAQTLNAFVMMIHHPKKLNPEDQKNIFYVSDDGRGSNAVKGALDILMYVGGKINSGDSQKPGKILLTIVKNKDDENEGKMSEIALTSKVITFPEYGKDEWGRELKSLVLVRTELTRPLDDYLIKLKLWIEDQFDNQKIPYKVEHKPTKFSPYGSVSFNSEDLVKMLPEYLKAPGQQKPKSRKELMIIINPEQDRLIGNMVKAGLLKYEKLKRGQYIFTTEDNYNYPAGGTWEIDELEKIKEEIAEQQQKELQELQSNKM